MITPRPGDLLECAGYPAHWGVWLGDGQVLHLQGDRAFDASTARVRVTGPRDFAKGRLVRVARRAHPAEVPTIARRAEAVAHFHGYNPLSANCEHLARYVATGRWHSDQVPMTFGYALGAVGLAHWLGIL